MEEELFSIRFPSAEVPALTVLRLSGRESMNDLFAFDVTAYATGADDSALETAVLGAQVVLAVQVPDGAPRTVAGIVVDVSLLGRTEGDRHGVRLSIVPCAWLLTKRVNTRIFQEKTVAEIAAAVLGEHRVAHRMSFLGEYPVREYCVQYQESDWDFVTRLFAEEALFFWFEQPVETATEEILVVADMPPAYGALPGGQELRFRYDHGGAMALEEDMVTDFHSRAGIETTVLYCALDDNTKGWVSSFIAGLAGKTGLHAYGAHHHKILLVYGSEGLVGFCGGIDIDPNRVSWLHDAHVRVQGSAAEELWVIATQRWLTSEDEGKPPQPASISILAPPTFPEPSTARYLARVVQTIGNPVIEKSVSSTLWPALKRAIGLAKSFIYMEDQYFWSLDLVAALVDAAKRLRHIALGELVKQGGKGIEEKVAIFQSRRVGHDYVHAKLFIMDDDYAMVSTANANNRGYFLDSEVAMTVAERAASDPAGTRRAEWSAIEGNFARRLRIELWAEHLGLPAEELFDGLGARVHWDALPLDAQVAPYHAINLKKYAAIQFNGEVREDWLRMKEEADKNGDELFVPAPGPPPTWDPDEDAKPWWEAPYDEWEPKSPKGDSVIDPKS